MKTLQKRVLFLGLCLILVFSQVFAQTFKEQFNSLVVKQDTLGQQLLLEKWEKADSNDPELYVTYFNYFVSKSQKETIIMGQNPKGENVLSIMSQDSSENEPVAYLYGDTYYDRILLNKGFDYIDQGIAKFPNRLDMRFGKIYMFGKLEDFESFTKEIIETIGYSVVNKNKWTWTGSKPLDDAKNIMLGAIQDYQYQLYNTNNDTLLEDMKEISETILRHYPDHVESLSNLSIVCMIQKDYDKALTHLLKAEKLDAKDYIVLGNIALAYKLKGDTKNAIKYYESVIKYGDEQSIQFAKRQIEELKQK